MAHKFSDRDPSRTHIWVSRLPLVLVMPTWFHCNPLKVKEVGRCNLVPQTSQSTSPTNPTPIYNSQTYHVRYNRSFKDV